MRRTRIRQDRVLIRPGGITPKLTVDNLYCVLCPHRIVASYRGPTVKLRRMLDSEQLDFTPGEDGWLRKEAVQSWAMGSLLYIDTLYDQTGNSRNATSTQNWFEPLLELSTNHPVMLFRRLNYQHLDIAADAFANNQSAASLIAVRQYNTFAETASANQLLTVRNNSTVSRMLLQYDGTTAKVRISGRRLDADSAAPSTGFDPDTNWATEIARYDWATAKVHHQVVGPANRQTETLDPFQTAGSTSATDSQEVFIGTLAPSGQNFFDGRVAMVALVRDLLTDQECDEISSQMQLLFSDTSPAPAYPTFSTGIGAMTNRTTVTFGSTRYAHTACRVPHQRQVFYASGRWWVFWADFNESSPSPEVAVRDLSFRSSADGGATWSADTLLTTVPFADAGWNIAYDNANNKVSVIKNITGGTGAPFWDGLEFRQGTPETNGSITWDAAFGTVVATTNGVGDHSAAYGSDGKLWIGYGDNDSQNPVSGSAIVIRNDNTDGTWSTTAGFPVTVVTGSSDDAFAIISPIDSGAMHVTVYEWDTEIAARGWTVDTAGTTVSEGDITATAIETGFGLLNQGAQVGRIDASGRDGVVHMAYVPDGAATVKYRRRSALGVWGSEVTLSTGRADLVCASPRVAFDGASNLVVMWSEGERYHWGAKSTDDGSTFSTPVKITQGHPYESCGGVLNGVFEHIMPGELSDGSGTFLIAYLGSRWQMVTGTLAISAL
jgi:hypothetical protein